MKARGILILLLMLLLFALQGAHKGSASGLHVAPAAPISIDCKTSALPPGFTFDVIPDASGTQAQTGDVLHTFLCNYIISTQSGQPSGMAITIDYNCPADTQTNWASKTSPRSNEVTRTANSLLTREVHSVSGFAGTFTVQEKLILLIDTHTLATIVVLTDADPNNLNEMVFSVNAGQAPAIALANSYASLANDPACPASASSSSTSGVTSQDGFISFFTGPWEWEHVNPATAAAVAVSVGAVAALLGGLLTGAIGTSMSTMPVSGAASAAPSVAGPIPSEALPESTPASPASATFAASSPPPEISPPVISPPVTPAIALPIVEAALAAGAATASVIAASSGEGQQNEDKDDEQDDVEKPCPEVQAYLFGLPAINSRNDCPGSRPSMGPWNAGIDFTSNDEHGAPANLDFEALVAGEVTYCGDSDTFNMIEVKLENGNRIQYLHASEVYVQRGQHVTHSTKLGKTGGVGPLGPNQYEIHLHVQAIDEDGNLIDPDCALASGDPRKLRSGDSPSPHRARIALESVSEQSEAEPLPLFEEEQALSSGQQATSTPVQEAVTLAIPVEDVQPVELPVSPMPPEVQAPVEELTVPATPELSVSPSTVDDVLPVEPPVVIEPQPALEQPMTPVAPPTPIELDPPITLAEEPLTLPPAAPVSPASEIIVPPAEAAVAVSPALPPTEPPLTEQAHPVSPMETTSIAPPMPAPAEPKERPIFCADCGQANQLDARFCLNCGKPIRRA